MKFIMILVFTMNLTDGRQATKVEILPQTFDSVEQCVNFKENVSSLIDKVKITKKYCVGAL